MPPDWRLRTSGLFRSAALRMQLSCLTPADGRSRSVRRPACRSSRASAEARSAGMLCPVRHRPRIMVLGGGRLSLRNTPSGSILAATGLLRPPCCVMRSAYPGNGFRSNVSGYSLRHSPRLVSRKRYTQAYFLAPGRTRNRFQARLLPLAAGLKVAKDSLPPITRAFSKCNSLAFASA